MIFLFFAQFLPYLARLKIRRKAARRKNAVFLPWAGVPFYFKNRLKSIGILAILLLYYAFLKVPHDFPRIFVIFKNFQFFCKNFEIFHPQKTLSSVPKRELLKTTYLRVRGRPLARLSRMPYNAFYGLPLQFIHFSLFVDCRQSYELATALNRFY